MTAGPRGRLVWALAAVLGLVFVLTACPRRRAIQELEAEAWVAPVAEPTPTPPRRDWLAYTYDGLPDAEVSWLDSSFGPRDRLLAAVTCRSCGPSTQVGIVPAGLEDPGAPPDGMGFAALERGATSLIEGSVDVLLTNPGNGDWELWVYHLDLNLVNFADNGAGFWAPDVPARSLVARVPFRIEGAAPSGYVTVEPGRVPLDGGVRLASFCTHCDPSAFVGLYPWDGSDSRGGDWRYERLKVPVGAGDTKHRFRAEVVNGGTYQVLLFDREPEPGVDPMMLYRTYLTVEGPEPEPIPPVPADWGAAAERSPQAIFTNSVVGITHELLAVLRESKAAAGGFYKARRVVMEGGSQERIDEEFDKSMEHAAAADEAAGRLLDFAWEVESQWARAGRCPEHDARIARFVFHAETARDRVLTLRVRMADPSSLEALQEIEALQTTIPSAIRAMSGAIQDPYDQRERCF